MGKLVKRLKELHLSYDRISRYLSILLVPLLLLNFLYPGQVFLLIAAFMIAGLIYVMNGLKVVKEKKQNVGISYIFFGILIILICYLTIRFFMAK